ncbi:MAG: hypothetical protein NC200_00245 [Candidatus Gastranaerophilales bacterium]|nr:hypothetical protein [Candidatus Gastranaerophilales bacterium]
MIDKTNEIAAKHLGKKSSGSETYDPTLLVAVPRQINREQYDLDGKNLPFEGWDIWHAYEFSSMTKNGIPVTRVMKIKYNCNNDYLIESKSLKLYLNSFNMSKYGKDTQECLNTCKNMIEKDLSNVLKTNVTINFFNNNAERIEIFNNFVDLMSFVDETTLKIEKFKEAPELIEIEETNALKEYYLTFDSLRSNCRVTHQPDFGDAFIFYKSTKHIKEDSLVKYLSSFRSEYHFHEECCEMIYKRLSDVLNLNDEILVSALYTRRGGIDICPSRWSKNCSYNIGDINSLVDITKYARKSIKQ